MFLNEYDLKPYKSIPKMAMEESTFEKWYLYWREQLFERIMRIFVWENTNEVKPKEIEQRLLLAGHCGITTLEGELTAMFGSFHGVTKYNDEWKYYNVRCPIYAGKRTIDKDVVVIDNNAIRNSSYMLVHYYSILLAHAEVTTINLLVNARDNGGIPVAQTEKQKQSIAEYQGKIFNGKYGIVTDFGNLGINYVGANRGTGQPITDIYQLKKDILNDFYSDIGVKTAFEKNNNAVVDEVRSNNSLLLLNISDMLEHRQKGAEAVNNMFGTNWSVKVNDEINYKDMEVVDYANSKADVSDSTR